MNKKFITLFTCLIIFTATVFSQTGKWKKARKINTIESYENFLMKNPDSEYKSSAIELIDSINFSQIDLDNLSDIRGYISNLKSDKYQEKAKIFDSLYSYNRVIYSGKSANYISYLKEFPQGKYVENANVYLEIPISKIGRAHV